MVLVVIVECFLSEEESLSLLTGKQMVILLNNCIMAYVLAQVIFAKKTPHLLQSTVMHSELESQTNDDWKKNSEQKLLTIK